MKFHQTLNQLEHMASELSSELRTMSKENNRKMEQLNNGGAWSSEDLIDWKELDTLELNLFQVRAAITALQSLSLGEKSEALLWQIREWDLGSG